MTYDTKAGRDIMAKRTPGEWVACNMERNPDAGAFDQPWPFIEVGAYPVFECTQGLHDRENARALVHAVNSHEAMCDLIEAQAARIAELEQHEDRAAEMARAAEDPSWFYGCQGGKYSWEP